MIELKSGGRVGTLKDLLESGAGWEENEETFYEDLYSSIYDEEYSKIEEEWNKQPFGYGDIIMVNKSKTSSTGSNFKDPHRVFILTSSTDSNGTQRYSGYELSSNVRKSNRNILLSGEVPNRDWWKSNIYINNYKTILEDGAQSDREAYIDLGTLYTFTNKELSNTGVKKGVANEEFKKFVKDTLTKISNNEDVSRVFWEK